MTTDSRTRKSSRGQHWCDNSDTYLKNEKLGEDLDRNTELLSVSKHQAVIYRNQQLNELRKNLEVFAIMKKFTNKCSASRKYRYKASSLLMSDQMPRPQTAGPALQQRRIRTPNIIKLDLHLPTEEDGASSSDDHAPTHDTHSRNKMRKYPNIRPFSTLGGEKAINEKQKTSQRRQKSAPPIMRRKKQVDRRYKATETEDSEQTNVVRVLEARESSLICHRPPVRPPGLSLRKLRETHLIDVITETTETPRADYRLKLIEANRLQFERLQARVKIFLKNLDDMKKQSEFRTEKIIEQWL